MDTVDVEGLVRGHKADEALAAFKADYRAIFDPVSGMPRFVGGESDPASKFVTALLAFIVQRTLEAEVDAALGEVLVIEGAS